MKYLKEVNYHYYSGYLDVVPSVIRNNYIPVNFYVFLRKFIGVCVRDFKKLFHKNKQIGENIDTWLLFQSSRTYDVMRKLDYNDNNYLNLKKDILLKYTLFYKFFHLAPLLIRTIIDKEYKFFLLNFKSLGLYEEAYRLLKKHMPNRIILGNDHTPIKRAFFLAAKNLGINTVYFQHAQVGDKFPRLAFDISFLYGQATLDIYEKKGKPLGKVELIGNLNYLSYLNNENKVESNNKIGIGLNILDDLKKIEELVLFLNSNIPQYEIIIRDHPDSTKKINIKGKYVINNSREESALEFLSKLDAVIAGNSSILSEAAALGVKPIYYYPYNDNYYDVYSFVSNNLCHEAKTFSSIVELITKKETSILNTNYFNTSLNSKEVSIILNKYSIGLR